MILASLLLGFDVSVGAIELPGDGQLDPNAPQRREGVAIELTRFEITVDALELDYDLRNDSNDDVWICTDLDYYGFMRLEVFLSADGQALKFIRRPDVPAGGPDLTHASCYFARLKSGQTTSESLSFGLPIFWPYRRSFEAVEPNESVARRLNLDIGCYPDDILGNLPTRGGVAVDEGGLPVPTAVELLKGTSILLQVNIDGVRIPWQVGDVESYPVYSDLLAQWFPGARQLVTRAQTVVDHVYVDYLRDKLENVQESTLRDFDRKNRAPVPLDQQLFADPNVILVTDPLSDGWAAFRERYPDSSGFTELSSAGFSDDHTEALVYVGNSRGGLTGAGFVLLLRWDGSRWAIQDSVMVWIS